MNNSIRNESGPKLVHRGMDQVTGFIGFFLEFFPSLRPGGPHTIFAPILKCPLHMFLAIRPP